MNNALLLLLLLAGFGKTLEPVTDTLEQKISKIPHKHVDSAAKFKAGDFNSFIASHIAFHNIKDNISGEVVLLVKIAADGQLTNVSVLKGLGPVIDREVTNAVKASPAWSPASLNGQPTDMAMILRIDMAIMGTLAGQLKQPSLINKPTPPAKQPLTATWLIHKQPLNNSAANALLPVNKGKANVNKVPVKQLALKPKPVSAPKAIAPQAKLAERPKPRQVKKPVAITVPKPKLASKPTILVAKKPLIALVVKPKPIVVAKPANDKPKPVVIKPPVVAKAKPSVAKVITAPKPTPVGSNKPLATKPLVNIKKPLPAKH